MQTSVVSHNAICNYVNLISPKYAYEYFSSPQNGMYFLCSENNNVDDNNNDNDNNSKYDNTKIVSWRLNNIFSYTYMCMEMEIIIK